MARVSSQNNCVTGRCPALFHALGVPVENGHPRLAEENRPAPSMRESDRSQRGMQSANACLKRREQPSTIFRSDVDAREIPGAGSRHEAAAPNDGIVRAHAPPKIREIDGIEGLPLPEADLAELLFAKRLGRYRQRQPRLRARQAG